MDRKSASDIGYCADLGVHRFFIADVILSASAATRKNARADGILPANKYDQFLDRHYPDERMDKIYANAQKVE